MGLCQIKFQLEQLALLSDLCSNPVLAGQQPLSRRQVHRYHPGRRAAVASSKVPKIAHEECRTRAPYLSYPPAFARGKERFRNRRRLPEPNAFAKDLVWHYVWQYHAQIG